MDVALTRRCYKEGNGFPVNPEVHLRQDEDGVSRRSLTGGHDDWSPISL